MSREKPRVKFMCFLCGESSEKAPELCSVNFHKFGEMTLNSKKNAFTGYFQQGCAHVSCLEKYMAKTGLDPENCVVCGQSIKSSWSWAMKLAVYVYRKPGCASLLSIHNSCFKKIKVNEFALFSSSFGSN